MIWQFSDFSEERIVIDINPYYTLSQMAFSVFTQDNGKAALDR